MHSYDHLDIQTLKTIYRSCPSVHFLVPLGVKTLLVSELRLPENQVIELGWWESSIMELDDQTRTEFICTPAQHNSGMAFATPTTS